MVYFLQWYGSAPFRVGNPVKAVITLQVPQQRAGSKAPVGRLIP